VTRGLVAAVTFLTRFSLGDGRSDPLAVAAAAPYYPVVGGAIGGGAGILGLVLTSALPSTLSAAIVVAAVTVATGAIHVDALADTADAAGGRTPADRLRIMRDHAVGAFGATAIALFVAVEVAAISALLEDPADDLIGFVAAFAASRAAAAPVAALLPYAREGPAVPPLITGRRALAGVAVAAGLCLPAGVGGLAAFVAAAAVTAAAALVYRRWLGGVTGDALGATIALAEVLALVAILTVR
jgi:adenosylcobinamide-GDP ribazoletransferase